MTKKIAALTLGATLMALPAAAQQPSLEDLMRQIQTLQRRVDELEGARRQAAPAPRARAPAVVAPVATPAAPPPAPPPPTLARAPARAPVPVVAPYPGLLPYSPDDPARDEPRTAPAPRPPAEIRAEVDEALRGSLDGLAMRVPNTDTSVRLYGFVRFTGYRDFNGRNQTDAAAVQNIPLNGSAADRQGGDGDYTARGSRIGVDTRTPTHLGQLDTTLEADFRGEISPGGDLALRLRLAFAELTQGDWRFLIGQANSLWTDGLFEAFHDATNLNQSFVRQAQLRVSRRFGENLTAQVSLEAPGADLTTSRGAITPSTRLDGAASPAFEEFPDLLGRLTWRDASHEYVLRGLVRQITLRPEGTTFAPAPDKDAIGFGIAAHARIGLGQFIPALGRDEFTLMGFYGEGLGRYLAGNSFGLGAVSNIGQTAGNDYSLDTVPSYGGLAAYRHFWSPTLRSNLAYSYARQDFPDYVSGFTPGSSSALSMNREMQQVIANVIWSPFAERATTRQPFGWFDLGLEYVWSQRDLEGGAAAAGAGVQGRGEANRIVGFAVARF
jgi:hypothetical protein